MITTIFFGSLQLLMIGIIGLYLSKLISQNNDRTISFAKPITYALPANCRKDMGKTKTVLLSFDIEEFDMPFEYGKSISFEEQIRVSTEGTTTILDILREHNVKATFFSTVIFATHASPIIDRIREEGHELASHGWYHSTFEKEHLKESKDALEKLSGLPVTGFRMPRMKPVDDAAIAAAGYSYNSSLNPVYLPGRYNNFFKPPHPLPHGRPHPDSRLCRAGHPFSSFSGSRFIISLSGSTNQLCSPTMHCDNYLNIYFIPGNSRTSINPTNTDSRPMSPKTPAPPWLIALPLYLPGCATATTPFPRSPRFSIPVQTFRISDQDEIELENSCRFEYWNKIYLNERAAANFIKKVKRQFTLV